MEQTSMHTDLQSPKLKIYATTYKFPHTMNFDKHLLLQRVLNPIASYSPNSKFPFGMFSHIHYNQ